MGVLLVIVHVNGMFHCHCRQSILGYPIYGNPQISQLDLGSNIGQTTAGSRGKMVGAWFPFPGQHQNAKACQVCRSYLVDLGYCWENKYGTIWGVRVPHPIFGKEESQTPQLSEIPILDDLRVPMSWSSFTMFKLMHMFHSKKKRWSSLDINFQLRAEATYSPEVLDVAIPLFVLGCAIRIEGRNTTCNIHI